MTLVVARVTTVGVRVAADMRVTDPKAGTPQGFLGAALKVILLRPTLCVGYAGNVGAALAAIRQVASEDLGAEETARHLLDAHRRSDPKADFLVASLRPSELIVLKDGRVQSCSAGWLGDIDAFTEYQRHYHDPGQFLSPREFYDSPERAADLTIAARMGNGMGAVVHGASVVMDGENRTVTLPKGGSHETVGEAIVYVVPRAEDDLFKYSIGVRAMAGRVEEPLPPGLGVVPPDLSAAGGGFSYSTLSSEQPGVGVIGLYFHQGELGVLYVPLLRDDPERYRRVSQDQFIERVRLQHGISLTGIGLQPPSAPAPGPGP